MSRTRWLLPVALLIAATAPAQAHFALVAPPSWAAQDGFGLPQKSAPCGQADPGSTATPTNVVTTFQAGSTITITVDEKIFHPGHYRVLLAQDRATLATDPPVTAGSTACGSTTITTTPTLPLLADGLLVHTSPFSGPQSVQVKLPDGMTCTNCTLQVVEFMSNHPLNNPGGCYYHHCANVNIVSGPVPDAGPISTDAGPVAGDAGGNGASPTSSGCAATGTGPLGGLAGIAIALGLAVGRRRR
jgi:hypothetical protein